MPARLIIEDDRVLNLGMQECLKEFGYKVMGAQTGEAAIKIVSEECTDLAVLDVNLPDMDGFQICKKIKNIRDVPIVFLTVRDEEQDIVTGFDMGAEDYIKKPFNITVLRKNFDIDKVLRYISIYSMNYTKICPLRQAMHINICAFCRGEKKMCGKDGLRRFDNLYWISKR